MGKAKKEFVGRIQGDNPLQKTLNRWESAAKAQFIGRKIVAVRYMSQEEIESLGWDNRALVLQLDDGNLIFPSRDDEGNDAGALFTNSSICDTFPVI